MRRERVVALIMVLTATTAERAQFTVAQGPCFHAHDTGHRIVATEEVIARQWPLFHDLIMQTPVRGILATPLRDELLGVGVLDLYFDRPDGVTAVDPAEVDEIAGIITSALVSEEMFPNFRGRRSRAAIRSARRGTWRC